MAILAQQGNQFQEANDKMPYFAYRCEHPSSNDNLNGERGSRMSSERFISRFFR